MTEVGAPIMTARKWYLLPVVLVAVVMAMPLAIGLWAPQGSGSAINRENCKRIQVGMTLAQVEEIMGGPARYEHTGALVDANNSGRHVFPENGECLVIHLDSVGFIPERKDPRRASRIKVWSSDNAVIRVCLDEKGRVESSRSLNVRPANELVRLVDRWLKLITG
jgi:hypothetical protein